MRCYGTMREGEFDCRGCIDCYFEADDDDAAACWYDNEYCMANCPDEYPEEGAEA